MSLAAFLTRRLVATAFVMLGTLVIVFVIARVIPGDPARTLGGPDAREEQLAQIRREYGLDRPFLAQLGAYLWRVVSAGDLGRSIRTQRPIAHDLALYFPATLELTTVAMVLASVAGVGLGVAGAVWRGSWIDHATRVLAVSGVSLPLFWIGLLLQIVVGYGLGWLPLSGRIDSAISASGRAPGGSGLLLLDSVARGDWTLLGSAARHLVLPVLTLSVAAVCQIMRVARTAMLEVLGQDYLRTAVAKGLAPRRVILVHALKNALLPVVTVIGLSYSFLLGGAFLVEAVFDWPGLGLYAAGSLFAVDFPALLGVALLFAATRAAVNLGVDLLYYWLDPRIA
jgi:peptide/nickel transport system permease protein